MSGDRERWSRVDALLESALDREPADRGAYLREACDGDEALRREVERLLELALDDQALPMGPGLLDEAWEDAAQELSEPAPGEPRPGDALGPYQIRELLGEGGMGRVYRAWDPALGREVAVKALAEAFAGAQESLRRFEREAKLLASLSHPNIAAIHGLLDVEGKPYLVLELVEGETLSRRLERGPLSTRETVSIARQLADALEEAHRKVVIHRDLKPTNVMVSPTGRVKVLDFGLAKAEPTGETVSGTLHTTRSGVVLGTAAYMSPEQARGETVDRRTDVWGFGCLLFEMLTGERIFRGRTPSDTLAAVLRDPVPFDKLPASTPPGLRRLVRRCLQREVHDRLQDMGDARLELVDLLAPTTATGRATVVGGRGVPRSALLALPWLTAAVAIVIAIAAIAVLPRRTPTPALRHRLALLPAAGLTIPDDYAPPFSLSPDGSRIVYRARREGEAPRLWQRRLDRLEAEELDGTDDAWQPFFSPDGEWIGFFADRKLRRVPAAGGRVIDVAEVGGNPRGATWGADGTIILSASQTSGLVRVDVASGRLRELTSVDAEAGERSHRWPHLLPGGRVVLLTVQSEGTSFDDARIEALDLEDGSRRVLVQGGSHPVYAPGGHLVYAREGRLFAATLNTRTLERGEPRALIDGVAYSGRNGGAQFGIAGDGTLVYGPGAVLPLDRHLVWADADGRLTRLATRPRRFRDPRIGPAGRRIAVRIGAGDAADLWVMEIETGTLTQLTFGEAVQRPVWGPGPDRISFAAPTADGWRIASVPADGSGTAETLLSGPHRMYADDWSADGRSLVYQERRPASGWDLWLASYDAEGRPDGDPRALVAQPINEEAARLSPDGRWLAYESDELDAVVQIYLRPFDAPGIKVRISDGGARFPMWGRDGTLYYWRTGRDRVLRVREPSNARRPDLEPVWDDRSIDLPGSVEQRTIPGPGEGADLAPDGRFLLLEPPPVEPPAQSQGLVVVPGWAAELESAPDQSM